MEKVLAYDLGGTKVEVGVVDDRGRILASRREFVELQGGKTAVVKQLVALGKGFLQEHKGIKKVGFASAGPLHPFDGVLLDPTNLVTNGKSWGKVPIVKLLEKGLKKKVLLENDAAAAVGAEHWIGAAKGIDDVLMLTLGTGLGTAAIIDGKLVRAGDSLHTEGGHMIVNYLDRENLCGCGNYGCAEGLLSGTGFQKWARRGLGDETLLNVNIETAARNGDGRSKEMFRQYGLILAAVIQNFVVLYAPKLVVLGGSFANAADLFVPTATERLLQLLERKRENIEMMPKIKVSKLNNHAGLIGAAYLAMHGRKS